jgi:transposase-like protein
VWVRDLPAGGRPVTLVWVKRIWRCPQVLCAKQTWTEISEAIRPRASLTERARAEICRRVGEDGASVAAVAREFGVGWRTAMGAVREHGRPRVDELTRLDGVVAVGVDETVFQHASLLILQQLRRREERSRRGPRVALRACDVDFRPSPDA